MTNQWSINSHMKRLLTSKANEMNEPKSLEATATVDKNELLTISQIRKETGCSKPAILQWIVRGVGGVRLKAQKFGNNWKARRCDLEDFVATLTAKSHSRDHHTARSQQTRRRCNQSDAQKGRADLLKLTRRKQQGC